MESDRSTISYFFIYFFFARLYNVSMKQHAASASIRKSGSGYSAQIKIGRRIRSYNFRTKNAARSFVRRNFRQMGTYC